MSAYNYLTTARMFGLNTKKKKKKKKRKKFKYMGKFWKMLHIMIRKEEKLLLGAGIYEEKPKYQRRHKKTKTKILKYGQKIKPMRKVKSIVNVRTRK